MDPISPASDPLSFPDRKVTRYPLWLAEEVVEKLVESYARATYSLCKGTGVSRSVFVHNLQNAFRFNQLQWNSYKKVLKTLDNDPGVCKILTNKRIGMVEKRKYLTVVKWIAQDEILDA